MRQRRGIILRLAPAILLSGAIAFSSVPARSEPSSVKGDVRCLLTMAYGASNSVSFKQSGTLAAFFFAGRVLGAEPKFDFTTRLRPEAEQMSVKDFADEAKRCGDIMTSAVRSLNSAQETLREIDLKPDPAPAPAPKK